MNKTIVCLLATACAVSAFSADASARPKHHRAKVVATFGDADVSDSIPLTVNRRSWLDPGPVAPAGTGNKYVTANTGQFIQTPIDVQSPDRFGRDALPGQPYVPGRSYPVVEFSTTPNGRVDIANELLPQNFSFDTAPSRPPSNYQPSFSPEYPDTP
jgi:hypothetical protein